MPTCSSGLFNTSALHPTGLCSGRAVRFGGPLFSAGHQRRRRRGKKRPRLPIQLCHKALAGLTAEPAFTVRAPVIGECPIALECRVKQVLPLGTHDMFLAEITAVDVDPRFVDEKGALHMERCGLLAYAHGAYFTLGKQLGTFGFSVRKRPARGGQPRKKR